MSPFGFHPDARVAAFIDGPNFHAAARQASIDIDYSKLLNHLEMESQFVRAYYYTALPSDPEEFTPVRPLIDWLDNNGYAVSTKPLREFIDPDSGRRRIKGSMSVDIAVDMMMIAPHIDHALLFSGDGDFTRLVQVMQDQGKRVTVVSTRKGDDNISDFLRRQADRFVEVADLASMISRSFRREPAVSR